MIFCWAGRSWTPPDCVKRLLMVGLSCRVMGTIVAFGSALQIRKINVEKGQSQTKCKKKVNKFLSTFSFYFGTQVNRKRMKYLTTMYKKKSIDCWNVYPCGWVCSALGWSWTCWCKGSWITLGCCCCPTIVACITGLMVREAGRFGRC